MKKIKSVYKASYDPIEDLVTYRALPTGNIGMEELNPFIFLNHHGPQNYSSNNRGLPFGPHPHRGMETVTFILEGDIMHKDNGGNESIINGGGIQWMTAGRGVIHAETSSEEFMKKGGPLEILQLWLNLAAKDKMTEPFYKGFQKEELPAVTKDNAVITVIAGEFEGTAGAVNPLRKIFLSTIEFNAAGELNLKVPEGDAVFFYMVRGGGKVNEENVNKMELAYFEKEGSEIELKCEAGSFIIFGYAEPLSEPIFAQGPFVMNNRQQIFEAYKDYQDGKF